MEAAGTAGAGVAGVVADALATKDGAAAMGARARPVGTAGAGVAGVDLRKLLFHTTFFREDALTTDARATATGPVEGVGAGGGAGALAVGEGYHEFPLCRGKYFS